ncbi:phosphoglycerate mutase-like protein [Annulohypoxylon bovei var. microspora]|nr:phosphoglycerate mutase-like protein [Annulohypoxylon bovei var. microspora]
MAPTIDIIRHAQAHHNLAGSNIPDPRLTSQGSRECIDLQARFKELDSGENITHVISSPMRRAIETSSTIVELAKDDTKITLFAYLQEVNATPSSTGTGLQELLDSYPYLSFDADTLNEDWYRKGPDTPFAPDAAKVENRALIARIFLRDAAREAVSKGQPNAHIVVVTHGEFAHWLTDDFAGIGYHRNSGWHNAEIRSYQFLNLEDTEGAPLVETPNSLQRRNATAAMLLSDGEKVNMKRIASIRVQQHAANYAERMQQEREARGLEEGEEWVDVDEEEADKENTEPRRLHPNIRRRLALAHSNRTRHS